MVQQTHVLTNNERALVLLFACGLAAVSIACEVMLFASQTHTPLDTALAVTTGFCLVGFQYLFAALGSRFYQVGKRLLGVFLFCITAVLFAVSVSGTAGFFESRLQTTDQTNTQESTQYQLQLATVDVLTKQERELTESAALAKAKGNTWYAGQLLDKAALASQARTEAIQALNTIESTDTTTVSALAKLIGQHRWWFWFLLASLVDVCPLVAFAVYRVVTPTQVAVTPKATPKQTNAALNKTPTVDAIKQAVKQHRNGPVGIRLAMREVNTTNYKRTKQAFDELEAEGFLTRFGKGYRFATEAV